jgi:hypothetical protein
MEQFEDRNLLSASAMSTLGGTTASFSLLNRGIVWETSGPNVGVVSGGVQGLYQGADSAGNLVAFELVNHFLYEYTPNQGWLGIGGADQVAQDANNHVFFREGGNLFEATGVPAATAAGSQFLAKGVQQLDQGQDFAGNPMAYELQHSRLDQVTQAPGLSPNVHLKTISLGRNGSTAAQVMLGLGIDYSDVAGALKRAYGMSAAVAGHTLQVAGADAGAIATALFSAYSATPTTIAGVLHGLHHSLNDVAAAINGISGGTLSTVAKALYTGISKTSRANVASAIYNGVGSVSLTDLAGGLQAGIPKTTVALAAAALHQGITSASATDLANALNGAFGESPSATADILNGLGYHPQDIAMALKSVFGSTDQQCARILKGLGLSLSTIVTTLHQVYNETDQAAALVLEDLGASFTVVATTLQSAFGDNDQAVAGVLKGVASSPTAIVTVLHQVFGDTDKAAAGFLNGLGIGATDIATALNSGFDDSDQSVAGILNGLGVNLTNIADALSGVFGDSDKATAGILNGLGVTPSGIASVLQGVFGDSNKTAAGILHGLESSYTNIATALSATYANTDQAIAGVLSGLGAGYSDIATALKNALSETDQATALLLIGQGAMPADVAPVLMSVFGDSDQTVAGIMNALGCTSSYVAQTLMKVYGDSDQAVASVLHGVGVSATDIATALKNVFADSDAATANILHNSSLQTADIVTALANVFGGIWSGVTALAFGSQATLYLIDSTGSLDSYQGGVLSVIFGGSTTTTNGFLTYTTTNTVTSMGVAPNGFLYFEGVSTTGSIVASGVQSLAPGSSQPQPVIVSVNEGPFGIQNVALSGSFVIDSLGRLVIGGFFGATDRYTINGDGSLTLYQSLTIPGDYVVMPDASIIYTAVDTGTTFEFGPNSTSAVPATEVTAIIFSNPTSLVVTGTAGNDTITVRQQHGQISVDGVPIFSNGQFVASIPASAVPFVQVHGAGGDDTIRYIRSPGESTSPSVSLYGDGGTGTLGGGDLLDPGTGNDYTGIMVSEDEVLDLSTGDLSINGVNLPTAVYNAVTAPYGAAAMYPLGTPLSSMAISGGSLYTFQNGVVYDTSAGIFLVTGPIFTGFQALGGEAVLGRPVTDMQGDVISGFSQTFSDGVISLVGGSVSSVGGPIYQRYSALSTQLGIPTGNAQMLPGGFEVQDFSNGCILAQGGQTGDVYLSTAGTVLYLDASSGNDQFEVYQTPVIASLGLFTTHVKWMGTEVFTTAGGQNITSIQANLMGADTLNVHNTSLPYTVGYAGFELAAPIWVEFSGMEQQLGNPSDNATEGNGITHQEFQNGVIYYSNESGAHAILGNPNDPTTFWGKFTQVGFNPGLGVPTSDAIQGSGSVYQRFENGYVYSDATVGADGFLTQQGVDAPDGSTWFLGANSVDAGGDHNIYRVSNGQVTRLPDAGIQLANNNGMNVVHADGTVAQWTGTTFQPYLPPAFNPMMVLPQPAPVITAGQVALQVDAGDPSTYPFEYAFGKAIGPYDAIKLGIITYYSGGTLDVPYLIANYFAPLAESEGKAILASIGSKLSINDFVSFVGGLVSDLISGDGSGTFDGFRFQVGFKVQQQGVLTNVFTGARDDLENGIGDYVAGALEGVLATNGLGDVVDFVNKLGDAVHVDDLTKVLLSGGVGTLAQAAGNVLQTAFGSGGPFGLTDFGPKSNVFIPYIAWQKM